MFAWPCSVTNGVVGKKKCSLWCNTETFFNNNNNGKASTSLLSAFYLSQLISYRASGGRRITNVFCFSPPSRKAYELTLKYIPVRVTSFPSRVLVHLLVHARIHFCTHTHTSGMTSFVPSRIFYFIFLPSWFYEYFIRFHGVIISYLSHSSLAVISFCFMVFIYSFICFAGTTLHKLLSSVAFPRRISICLLIVLCHCLFYLFPATL